ncbi:hypothetical protein GCM10020258_11340 [Sphingomonas yabuuchiae]
MTRPNVTMAPTVQTPIAKLASTSGVVTAKGRVAEVFGDRFVVQDGTGRAMVASNRDAMPAVGSNVMVQGRYDDGIMHAQYLVGPQGRSPRSARLRPRRAVRVAPMAAPVARVVTARRRLRRPRRSGRTRCSGWSGRLAAAPAGWLRTGCGAPAAPACAGKRCGTAGCAGSAAPAACRGSGTHRCGSPGAVIRT